MFVRLDDIKKWTKNFCHCENNCFLKCLFLSTLRSQWKDLIFLTKNLKKPCGPYKLFLTFFMLEITRKIRPKSFHHWKVWPFFKTLCFNNFSGAKKCCFIFQCKCHKSLWTLLKCSVSFVTFENTRENGRKTFVIVKTAIFRNVCFYRPLRSRRNDINNCTIFVKIHCGPF